MLQELVQIIKSVPNAAVLVMAATLVSINIAHSADVEAQGMEQIHNMVAKKSYSQALETIVALTAEEQNRLDIRFYRATSLAGSGKIGEAIEAFEQLIKDEPQHPEFYNNLAMLLVEENKLLEAQQALELGLRSRESYAMLYNNLTVVFETMARRSYAKALRVKKEQSPVLSPLLSLESFTPPEEQAVTVVATIDKSVPPVVVVAEAEVVSTQGSTVVTSSAVTYVGAVSEENRATYQQVESLLNSWIGSWQRQDIDGYIESYSPNFKSRAYSSRQAWMEGRSDRISRATQIEISMENIVIEALSSERIQAEFVMDYRSDRYSDRSKKRIIFKRFGGEWRIVRELTLEVLDS